MEELEADRMIQVMKTTIIGDGCATIDVERTKILEGIDVARSYPKQLKFTLEVFQKLFLELDGQKVSSKSNESQVQHFLTVL